MPRAHKNEMEMENEFTAWVARDETGDLNVFEEKPVRFYTGWILNGCSGDYDGCIGLPENAFPDLKRGGLMEVELICDDDGNVLIRR